MRKVNGRIIGRWTICLAVAGMLSAAGRISRAAEEASLAFAPATSGTFAFDTGALKGHLQATEKAQSLASLVDRASGIELTHGGTFPGLFSYYRLFSAGKRYGDAMRDWPRSAKLLPDGAVEIVWPARPDRPAEVTATFRWTATDTLDLETAARPQQDMANLEVFVSSYFNKAMRCHVYTSPTLHARGKPSFLACEFNPFIAGTYLAFPRDRRAAHVMYDGRWDFPPHPVHLSTGRYFAAPLAIKRDEQSGLTAVLMSHPDDCFMILASYDKEPPDGIAGHHSVYFSLFGYDVKAGERVRARTRLVVGRNVGDENALGLYKKFLSDTAQRP